MDSEAASVDPIQRLLVRATKGDRRSLIESCQQLKVFTLAVALKAGASWQEAVDCVDPNLRLLCKQVLDGEVKPSQWQDRLISQVQTTVQMNKDAHQSESAGLSGLEAIPRLAKRRAVRESLLELPLPQLTGVLLKRIGGARAADMIGLVADSEQEAAAVLAAAYDAITHAMQEAAQQAAARDADGHYN